MDAADPAFPPAQPVGLVQARAIVTDPQVAAGLTPLQRGLAWAVVRSDFRRRRAAAAVLAAGGIVA